MKQVSILIPQEMYKNLKIDAAENYRNFPDNIRYIFQIHLDKKNKEKSAE